MNQDYVQSLRVEIKNIFEKYKNKFSENVVRPLLERGTYDKIIKDIQNYLIRRQIYPAIKANEDLINKLTYVEGYIYDNLHGNLTMILEEDCEGDNENCREFDNLNATVHAYENEIIIAFYTLHLMLGRPQTEFIIPDEASKILFLVQLLCTDSPEYVTRFTGNLREAIEKYCKPIEEVTTLPEGVADLPPSERKARRAGPSIIMRPGEEPVEYLPPIKKQYKVSSLQSNVDLWGNPIGGKRRKTKRSNKKKHKKMSKKHNKKYSRKNKKYTRKY